LTTNTTPINDNYDAATITMPRQQQQQHRSNNYHAINSNNIGLMPLWLIEGKGKREVAAGYSEVGQREKLFAIAPYIKLSTEGQGGK